MTARQAMRRAFAGVERDDRLVTAAPPSEAQPERQVDVLQVGEVALVEAANVEHRLPAIQRGARARSEHLAGLIPAPVVGPKRPRCSQAPSRRSTSPASYTRAGSRRSSILHATDAAVASPSRHAAIRASQSSATTTSVFSRATYCPVAALMPQFAACAKPVFRPSSITRTSGNEASNNATDPSSEPLSTTITSEAGASWRASA